MVNDQDAFPELKYEVLKLFAQRMFNHYDFIERITVHHAPLWVHQRYLEKIKYVMLFQLANDPGRDGDSELSMLINVFKKHFEIFNGPPEIDEQFFPQRHEWRFVIRYRDQEFPSEVSEDEGHWVLFENESRIFDDLLTKASPEIEKLYKPIKEIGFSGRNPNADDAAWREAALQHFHKNQKQFKLVKREYLEDKDLYAFTVGQEARDFKGSLLQKIVEGKGFGKQSAQKLAKLQRQILSNK